MYPCVNAGVSAVSLDEYAESSLFVHPRHHHILEKALASGRRLSLDSIREKTGISREDLDAITHMIEDLGGSVSYVSSFGDWLQIRLPTSLVHQKPATLLDSTTKLSRFLEVSTKGDGFLVHHVAAGVIKAGLESLVSHMYVHSVVSVEQWDGTVSRPRGRSLHAADEEYPNIFDILFLDGPKYHMFTNNKSDATLHIGTWLNSPTMFVQCSGETSPYLVGQDTDSAVDCTKLFDQVTIVMEPRYSAQVNSVETVRLDMGTDIIRKTCKDVPDVCDSFDDDGVPLEPTDNTYVYGIPLYKYALPNVLYEATMHISLRGVFSAVTFPLNDYVPKIYNYANASVWSIRDLYGVDPDLQGTEETIQGTALYVAVVNSSVNVTTVNEYLDLNGISSYRALEIDDSIAPNNASQCLDEPGECGEEMLDVEVLQSFAPNATTVFTPSVDISRDTENAAASLLRFLDAIADPDTGLDVVSISWARDYSGLGVTIEVLENRLKQLATLGKTVLAATGDGGADSFPGNGCWSTSSSLVSSFQGTSWPASSPWVTAVGATQLLATGPDFETQEVACMHATNGGTTSSGGFSGKWLNISTPVWQQRAVDAYLQSNNASTFSGFPDEENTPNYNSVGRGYPDISAYGAFYPILSLTGSLDVSAGTSLSAPMVASIFSLANQKLVSEGYEKIGYANPMLYWLAEECPDALNDITVGNNQVGIGGDACPYGFPAAPGWDPVTGLGTLRFDPFVQCVKKWQDREKSSRSQDDIPPASHAFTLPRVHVWILVFCVVLSL